jgi:hypothetical protein
MEIWTTVSLRRKENHFAVENESGTNPVFQRLKRTKSSVSFGRKTTPCEFLALLQESQTIADHERRAGSMSCTLSSSPFHDWQSVSLTVFANNI